MYLLGLFCNANFFITKRSRHEKLSMSKMSSFQWPLFMFTCEHKIPEPSLICEHTSLHLHSLCMDLPYSQVPCEFI